jgi:hypothetical protein
MVGLSQNQTSEGEQPGVDQALNNIIPDFSPLVN